MHQQVRTHEDAQRGLLQRHSNLEPPRCLASLMLNNSFSNAILICTYRPTTPCVRRPFALHPPRPPRLSPLPATPIALRSAAMPRPGRRWRASAPRGRGRRRRRPGGAAPAQPAARAGSGIPPWYRMMQHAIGIVTHCRVCKASHFPIVKLRRQMAS